jgi:hypothetical protein
MRVIHWDKNRGTRLKVEVLWNRVFVGGVDDR